MKTTLLRNLIIVGLTSFWFLSSCKNDTELIDFKNIPTAEEFSALRQTALNNITKTFTFNAEDGLHYISPYLATIDIPPHCLQTQDGQAINGQVTLSFIEIYDRGNMVLTNKPLMGKDINGNLLPLITGGQFNIKIIQGDQELKTGCSINIRIPTSNTGGNDDDMLLWKGQIKEDGNLIWEEEELQAENIIADDTIATYVYNIWADRFGWTNVDRFYNDNRPKTKIKVMVPNGYTNQNSSVYLSYEGERNLLAQLDIYDNNEKYFSEHYGFIPIDLNVHIIFVSENDGNATYAIKKVKISPDAIISILDTELQITTLDDLATRINALE